MPRYRRLVLPLVIALVGLAPSGASASGSWSWPVVGPVVHGFDAPTDPYGSGHRGIDIGTAIGTVVRAPAAGVVTFAGKIGGELFVTLDHGGGLRSTYSWLSALLVWKGDAVAQGAGIALSGAGHPGSALPPHLHFGVKLDGIYVDPMDYLAPASLVQLIRLAPLASSGVT